jgi:hypothetical protein
VRHPFGAVTFGAVVIATAVGLTATSSAAQTPQPGAIPRPLDGRPDLSGFWQVVHTSAWLDIQDHSLFRSSRRRRRSASCTSTCTRCAKSI